MSKKRFFEILAGALAVAAVAGVLLDGKEYNLPYIDYSDIMRGAHLEFMMSADKIKK